MANNNHLWKLEGSLVKRTKDFGRETEDCYVSTRRTRTRPWELEGRLVVTEVEGHNILTLNAFAFTQSADAVSKQ